MTEAPAVPTVRTNGLSPLEVATHVLFGPSTATVLPAAPGGSARDALERSVLEALRRPPCLVTFSGGRDSSAMLGLAARVARREGLPPPIPLTGIYAQAPQTEESEWQQLVLEHVGLDDWRRRAYGDELDLVGPRATAMMRRDGLPYPYNLHLFEPLIAEASGGSLITGVGGDQVLHAAGGFRDVLARRRRPSRRDLAWVAVGLSPRPVRRRALRDQTDMGFSWLRPEASATMDRLALEQELGQPIRWDRNLAATVGARSMRLNERRLGALAAEHDVRIRHPFTSPGFVAAFAREGGWSGFQTRTVAMQHLFSDVMPPELNRRPTKAFFDEVLFSTHARAFVRGLDESRLAAALATLRLEALVDPPALLADWRSPTPQANSFLLLQACWLALDQERSD